VKVLSDGTYLSVVMDSTIRAKRRETILDAALDEHGRPRARLVRVVEYDVPDRAGNDTGELIVLLTTILDPADARADELAGGLPPTVGRRDRQRPTQDPPARPRPPAPAPSNPPATTTTASRNPTNRRSSATANPTPTPP
jgi:hypothetical protein